MIKEDKNIIKFLKENWKNGRAFIFLPCGIKQWIRENINNPFLMIYNPQTRNWEKFNEMNTTETLKPNQEPSPACIFSLPDNFKPSKAEKNDGKWIDFEINEKGFFKVRDGYCSFKWYAKDAVLSVFPDLVNFGGWYYNKKGWSMIPMIEVEAGESSILTARYATGEVVKPMLPTKIRFWQIETVEKVNIAEDFMSEEEIIKYLKGNYNVRTPIREMPSAVRMWLLNYVNFIKCHKLNGKIWCNCRESPITERVNPDEIFCLID